MTENTQEQFDAQVKSVAVDAVKEEVGKLEIPSTDGLATKEAVTEEVNKLRNENSTLQKEIDETKEQVKSFTIMSKGAIGVTLKEDLNKKENQEGLKALQNKEVNAFSVKLSPESEVHKALAFGTGTPYSEVPQEMRDNEIQTNPHYQNSIAANLVNATTSNKDIVRYIREADETGASTQANSAAGKAHGAAFAEKAFELSNFQETIVTIGEFVTLHEEQLSDVAGLRSFVTQEFMGDLTDLVDQYILTGTGGSNNQLNGFSQTGQHTDWADSAGFTVTGANNIDVLIRAISQLEEANYMADTIILNPAEFWGANLTLAKSSQNEYVARQILQQAMTGVMPMLGGAKILRSNAVSGDAYYVLDSKKAAKLWTGEGMELEFARNGDDFRNNQVSGRIKCRKALTVGRPSGIIVGDFSTDRTALAT